MFEIDQMNSSTLQKKKEIQLAFVAVALLNNYFK